MKRRVLLLWGLLVGIWLSAFLVNYWFATTYVSGLIPQVLTFIFLPTPYIVLSVVKAALMVWAD